MVSSERTPEFPRNPELELAWAIESMAGRHAVVTNAEQTAEYGNYQVSPDCEVLFTAHHRRSAHLPSLSHYEIMVALTDGSAINIAVDYKQQIRVDRLPYDPEVHGNLVMLIDMLQTTELIPNDETCAGLQRLEEQEREL